MIEQSTAIINTSYFDSLTEKIKAAPDAVSLQKYVDEIFASLKAQKSALLDQGAQLEPYLALADGPGANPSEIVTWINKFITASIMPQVKAYATAMATCVQVIDSVSSLSSAVQTAAKKFPDVTISIPSV